MSKIDAGKMATHPNGVEIGVDAITDVLLHKQAKEYKKNIASRYKLYSERDIRSFGDEKFHTSLKYDGQLHFLYKDSDEIFLFNPNGRVVQGLTCLEDAQAALKDVDQVLLAGELYSPNGDGRSRVYDVTSALGSAAGESAATLSFVAFNVLEANGEDFQGSPAQEAVSWLADILPTEGLFRRADQRLLGKTEIMSLYTEQVVDNGHEGLVCVAPETPIIYKIKQRHNVDAVVVGFTERPDEPGKIRVLLTALQRPDGSFQIFSKVGGGFDEEERRSVFNMLHEDAVPSEYKEVDRNHTLFTMVKPKHVLEVSFLDLITETGSENPQMKAVLNFTEEGYEACLAERFVTVIAPTFSRFRDDKEVNPQDLRLEQLRDLVDLDNLDGAARQLDLEAATICQRQVFTKESKGALGVRKFVSWKTNKESLDADFAPYVFCFVDYSPTRKSPMKRVVRTAQTVDEIEVIQQSFVDEYVKKGWVEANSD